MQNALPSFFLSSSQFLNSQLNCWVMTLKSIKQHRGLVLVMQTLHSPRIDHIPILCTNMNWIFPILNKQISYVFYMNLQSCRRKLHFYAISDLSLGWPRRNRDLWLPFICSLIIHLPRHVMHSQTLLGRREAVQVARQVFWSMRWFQFRAHRAEYQPLSLQCIIVIVLGLGCWAGSLIFWARAVGLWDWLFIFKDISTELLKWSITPEIDYKIVFNSKHRNKKHHKKIKHLPCDG